ncbi:DNA internalization-related competence protein ComEC/Rec2 [Caviibacterium pharyngocola]|uniref:DNA internalization-related competence protein ComEC/Rec2 n=1 Tax=Caviibacterium pharyngocola TaxID=28159 RepID=UPI003C2EE00D
MEANRDCLIASVIFSALSLLWVPKAGLLEWRYAFAAAGVCGVIGIAAFAFGRYRTVNGMFIIIWTIGWSAYFHSQALSLLQQAEQVSALPKKVTTEFYIEEILRQADYQTLVISAKFAPHFTAQRAYARWTSAEPVKAGEYWRGELQLRSISSLLNEGGFDRQKWYFAKHITAYANIKSAVKIKQDFSFRQSKLNRALKDTEHLASRGLLLALGFGERAWLDNDIWEGYRQTNTAHLIAISGLHIGLAMLIGFGLCRMVQFLLPTRLISPLLPLCGAVFFAWFYALLAGFSIPTFRAITALIMVAFFRFNRRYYSVWRLLCYVVTLLLILDPMMLLSASFWLSVGAVACLILWYRLMPLSLFLWRGKSLEQRFQAKVRYVFGLFHLQFGLILLFTPAQLFFFNGTSLNGFIANLLAVPFFSFLLVPVILFAVITDGACYSWTAADYFARFINALLARLQGYWTDLSWQQSFLFTALCLLLLAGYAQGLLRKHADSSKFQSVLSKPPFLSLNPQALPAQNWLKKVRIFALSGGTVCFIAWANESFDTVRWRMETLDVGQGLATLIVQGKRAILYDTGAGWQNGSMAKSEILPYLRRRGLTLEKLILSHDDNDHSGGAREILGAYSKVELITSSRRNYGESHRTFCYKGQQWQWGDLHMRVLSPQNIVDRADNPHSCVLLIDDGKRRVLLTGDADVMTENQFVAELNKIDVLQVGHHGSKSSTGSRLVTKTEPEIAVISSGRWNPWRFPHSEVVNRLKAQQSAVYNTAVFGQINVIFYTDKMEVKFVRSDFAPWYRGVIGI